MMSSVTHLDKIDDRLARVLNTHSLNPDEKMPIALLTDPSHFDAVIAAVQDLGGTVRHRLAVVGAVVAWVPIRAVESLADLRVVSEIELDHQVHIA